MRILFTDDQFDTRKLYLWAFELYGHTVRVAANGEEAIEAMKKEEFDIVVMDIEMPGMSGWEAVRQIRQLPFGRSVPIAMYTAYYSMHDVDKAHAVGANTLLTKPMMPEELNRSLEDIYQSYQEASGAAPNWSN